MTSCDGWLLFLSPQIFNRAFAAFLLFLFSSAPVFAEDIISGREFRLIDFNGKMTAQLTTSQEGTPSLFFYDASGKVKLNLGIYPDGAPGIILFDNNNQAAALLRLAEANGQPVLIFKEGGQDKMIIGLHSRSIIQPDQSVKVSFRGFPSFLELLILIITGLVAGFIGARLSSKERFTTQ